jgi:hypothetical protein
MNTPAEIIRSAVRISELKPKGGTIMASIKRQISDPEKQQVLALQLPFCFEVSSLSDRLMSSTPE